MLLIHGAGMSKHESRVLSLASFAVEHGYAGIAIDYGMGLGAAEPKHLEDTFCALAWIYANADGYGLDRERVVVFGASLGGRIAANLGVVDDASLFLTGCPHQLTEADSVQGVVTFGGALRPGLDQLAYGPPRDLQRFGPGRRSGCGSPPARLGWPAAVLRPERYRRMRSGTRPGSASTGQRGPGAPSTWLSHQQSQRRQQ
jgi:pimeloyl-ACP methyl ester carboxylesterase